MNKEKKNTKIARRIIVGVLIAVIGGLILAWILRDEPKKEDNKRTFIGNIIDFETRKSVKDVRPNIIEDLTLSNTMSDDDGRFKIILEGTGTMERTLKLEHPEYESKKIIRKFDFDSDQSPVDLGEFVLKKKTNNPCERITQIIFEVVDEKTIEATPPPQLRETSIPGVVLLDVAFEHLVNNRIGQYLSTLDLSKNELCPKYLKLKEWLDQERLESYKLGEYEISNAHKILLDLAIKRIEINRDGWKYNITKINTLGAADQTEIDGTIILDKSKTGITFGPSQNFDIYYSGCTKNKNDIQGKHVPIEYGKTGSTKVSKNGIEDNCDLSATRGYIVAKYIYDNLLNKNRTVLTYSAKGSIGKQGKNPINRRADVFIHMKLAKIEKNSNAR